MVINTSRRAVLTGMGLLTPIGTDADSCWQALLQGRGGVRSIQAFDVSALPTRIAGELANFDARQFVEKEHRKALRMMARPLQLAVAGAQKALEHAGVKPREHLDPTRFGVIYGAGLIAIELPELLDAAAASAVHEPGRVDLERWGTQSIPQIPPLWMLKYLPNMMASHVSMQHDAQGPNNTVTESDVAGLLALSEGYHYLRRDLADFLLVGGAESKLNPLSLVRQCLYEPMSRRNDDPAGACRPFDRRRDGQVLGEGAGVFVLEELEHARKRGATIYAEVVGVGSAFDHNRTGQGIARAIRTALAHAGIGPGDIDHINANGLATIPSDIWEGRGLNEVFGGVKPAVPVFAGKGFIGNLGAASSLAELAVSVLALHHGQLPGSINHQEPDPECSVTVHTGAPRSVTKDHVLKISFTQMGQCGAVVLRKFSA